jgi:hypothetical protein
MARGRFDSRTKLSNVQRNKNKHFNVGLKQVHEMLFVTEPEPRCRWMQEGEFKYVQLFCKDLTGLTRNGVLPDVSLHFL